MTVYASPFGPKPQFMLATGLPAVGYQLFSYVAGSVGTKQNTYTDSTGGSANTNPIVLNSLGEPTTQIWLTGGQTYKFVLAPANDTDPPTSPVWTIDNLSGINDVAVASASSEWTAFGGAPTYVSATQFTLVGDQTSTFTIGRRVKCAVTAGTSYGTITATAFGAVTTITLDTASGSNPLDAGLSAVSYGALSSTFVSMPNVFHYGTCNGRLTTLSATPVTTTDVTGAPAVIFAPYGGNSIGTYNGTYWTVRTFTEKSIVMPAALNQMYDVFIVDGTLALELLAWTNDTTRATALASQDGVLVKSGTTTRRYLGSVRSTGVANQTEDSAANRYVWNYYNRVQRKLKAALETTDTWAYSTATIRQANANTANQLNFIVGYAEDAVWAQLVASARNDQAAGTVAFLVGIGLDSTTAIAADCLRGVQNNYAANFPSELYSNIVTYPGIGKHSLTWLEYVTATGNTTWIGDNGQPAQTQTGISGMFPA